MGTDIHVTAQKRINGEWVDVPTDFMSDRNYAAFGWLADVRNYADVPPLADLRGWPIDADHDAADWHHGHTWYSLEELTSFDFDQPVENRRVTRQMPGGWFNGGCTADPGEGEMTTYRGLFGEYFMDGLKQLADSGVERILISFDS